MLSLSMHLVFYVLYFSATWLTPPPAPQPLPLDPVWQLFEAYNEAIAELTDTPQGLAFVFKSGRVEIFNDLKSYSVEERMDDSDLSSIFQDPYPRGAVQLPMKKPLEPGRFRNYALLQSTYGANLREVKKNLVKVDFLGMQLRFNKKNKAAESLAQVAQDIRQNPEAMAFMRPLINSSYIYTWYWRFIHGTRRLSAHAFGIAIDISNPKSKKPKYWLWTPLAREDLKKINEIEWVPQALVDIFEKHGFIWGGKWHHFDTIHFEYRPEFFVSPPALARPTAVPTPLRSALLHSTPDRIFWRTMHFAVNFCAAVIKIFEPSLAPSFRRPVDVLWFLLPKPIVYLWHWSTGVQKVRK
jgi:hypothetical protein